MQEEKKEKKSKLGVDKYGRPFQFDGNSVPKLMNREQKRAMKRREKRA